MSVGGDASGSQVPLRTVGGGGTGGQSVEAALFQLTTNVSQYRRLAQGLGSGKDTPAHRQRIKQLGEKISGLAKDVSGQLKAQGGAGGDGAAKLKRQKLVKDFSALLQDFQKAQGGAGGDGAAKLKRRKLVKDFSALLQDFQKAQRECAEREAASLPRQPKSRAGRAAEAQAATAAEQEANERQALLAERRRQEQQQLDSQIEFNDALIEEREQGIVEIQHQIGEVNEIFQDLALLVNEQGEMIEDIESNIVRTGQHTSAAVTELKKADKSHKNLRNKFCFMFVVVAVIIAVLLFFLMNR